jgi:ribonucleoside-diphosphate reductase beta chain
MTKVKQKQIFNQDSKEAFDTAKIIGGNPSGIYNFNGTNHQFATSRYKVMEGRTWFPRQVNISKDKVKYTSLNKDQKRAYDLVLAQLIANDSIQANQLMDKINAYITSPIVNACLIKQACEEVTHSFSYAVMAEDIASDTDRIYNLHHHDEELAAKNKVVKKMFDSVYTKKTIGMVDIEEILEDSKVVDKRDQAAYIASEMNDLIKEVENDITPENILLACGANQILEELVFPGGFAVLLSMSDIMPGSAEMISEISTDETLSHVPLFRDIYRHIIDEEFNGRIPLVVEAKLKEMILDMVKAEKRWTTYVAEALPGFSKVSINILVESQANSICSNLRLPHLFDKAKVNPLKELLVRNLKGGNYGVKDSFFESNSVSYTLGGLEIDY